MLRLLVYIVTQFWRIFNSIDWTHLGSWVITTTVFLKLYPTGSQVTSMIGKISWHCMYCSFRCWAGQRHTVVTCILIVDDFSRKCLAKSRINNWMLAQFPCFCMSISCKGAVYLYILSIGTNCHVISNYIMVKRLFTNIGFWFVELCICTQIRKFCVTHLNTLKMRPPWYRYAQSYP